MQSSRAIAEVMNQLPFISLVARNRERLIREYFCSSWKGHIWMSLVQRLASGPETFEYVFWGLPTILKSPHKSRNICRSDLHPLSRRDLMLATTISEKLSLNLFLSAIGETLKASVSCFHFFCCFEYFWICRSSNRPCGKYILYAYPGPCSPAMYM